MLGPALLKLRSPHLLFYLFVLEFLVHVGDGELSFAQAGLEVVSEADLWWVRGPTTSSSEETNVPFRPNR